MDVGTYLSGTSGTSLEINDLLEIEALFNLITGPNYNLPEGVNEDTILDLYGYVSELAIMRKEDKISNLPKKAKQTGAAFHNAAALLNVIIPIMIFNYELI